jgi:hypothetical protein
MRNGMICKKTGIMKVKETSFKDEDIGNQARNQSATISSSATINRSAARDRGNKKWVVQ